MNRAARALFLAISVSALMAATIVPSVGAAQAIPLNAGQEADVVNGGGHGFFSYTIDGDELCYTLSVEGLSMAPFGAHIHYPGPRGVAAPIVVPLATPPAATSTVSACITASEGGAMTPAELATIVADPRAHYVNVHTTNYPGGEIRGQLK
jgi:hypothetical protein